MNKIEKVKKILRDENIAIAFSGGSDSTLLAYLSSKVAKNTLAITVDNNLMPKGFVEDAERICEGLNIDYEIINIDFWNDSGFLENDEKRCFNCRNLMYSKIKELAEKRGFEIICDGNNLSDLLADRPGILITYDKEFKTPLIDANLTSSEIHRYLKENDIHYSKSTTCLATRIPTNTKTTKEKIRRISQCEEYILSNTNCEIVKVRDNNETSVCEVDNINEILKDNKYKQINDELKHYGFKKILLNLSPIKNTESISIDYEDGSFTYELPYTIKNYNRINVEKIKVNENGKIEGNNFKNYKEALNAFIETLKKIRRNV